MKWKRLYVEKEEIEELDDMEPVMDEEPIDLDTLVLNIVDDELVEEGAGKAIAFSILAFLLSSAGIVEGAEFRRGTLKLMKDKQVERGGKVTITRGELKGIIEKAKAP